MRKISNVGAFFVVLVMTLTILTSATWAQEGYNYNVFDWLEILKNRALFEDPRPYLEEGRLAYKNCLTPNFYGKITYDIGKMKQAWAEVVGFRSPDEVGKIAPEIKPGTYNYKDKEKFPGLKELMPPGINKWYFTASGPPFAGNFPEIKVVPTRQIYFALPIAEASKKYEGQSKLDSQGYLIPESYNAGYPFPKPSGEFKAKQIVYNCEKRYVNFENHRLIASSLGFTKNLKIDRETVLDQFNMRLQGRLRMEPFGWFDERAKGNREAFALGMKYLAPRDSYGNALGMMTYDDPNKFDYSLIYINALRRIRTMSQTDTQDSVGGQDAIYEDREGFSQKLSPKRYPYEFKLIDEREYLVPVTLDGSAYLSSGGKELRNLEFQRRPVYVIELTQLDKTYVYGKRIMYFDKETFLLFYAENYNQKGVLYRSCFNIFYHDPATGYNSMRYSLQRDHIDQHSSISTMYHFPLPRMGRDDTNLQSIVSRGK